MGKYEQLAKDIVKNVGGKNNIAGLTHCVTRLRFKLVDQSKANDEAIKNLDGVVKLMKSGGQYQVVIGNHVPDVYKEVVAIAGISSENRSEDCETKEKMSFGAKFMDIVSGIFLPSLGVLTASGMLKGFLIIFLALGVLKQTDGLYLLLNAVGDTVFKFFPVFIGLNAAKKFGLSNYVGIAIGAALCYPDINGTDLNIFGHVFNVSYYNTILPVIFTVAFATQLEKFFNRFIPSVVKAFLVPMLVLLIAVPLGFLIIGPLSNLLSNGIISPINALVGFSPAIAGFIIGGLWQLLIILGLHMPVAMLGFMDLIAGTPNTLLALIMTTAFAQTAVVFGIWLKTKDKTLKTNSLGAWISGVFGVTEPAIYGITLPRLKFFIISCIGSALGSAYYGLVGVKMHTVAGMGLLSIPGFIDQKNVGSSVINCLIGIAIAVVFSLIATLILYKDDKNTVKENGKTSTKTTDDSKIIIKSPMEGEILPLASLKDEAFASEVLGKGIAIKPHDGKVIAPFNGTVNVFFPSHHAIGLESNEGVQLLIHVGMDTVQLEGKHFTPHVKQGDTVKAGDLLLEFDIEKIVEAGYPIETPIIVANTNDYLDVIETQENLSRFNQDVITVVVR